MSTLTTHGIRSNPQFRELDLPAVTLGHSVTHDPDALTAEIPATWADGPSGIPLVVLEHARTMPPLVLEYDNLRTADYTRFLELQSDAANGASFDYSALGVITYMSQGWRLVSTDRDWTETRHGVWAARIHLIKRGGTY